MTTAPPPRVLMVMPRLGRSGRATAGGITRAVDAWRAGGLSSRVELDVVPMAVWDAPRWLQAIQTVQGMFTLARRLAGPSGRPDVVHVHVSSGGSLYRKYLAAQLARIAGVPVVVHLHSGGFEQWVRRRRVHMLVARRLFGSAAVVVVLAERWRTLVQSLGAESVSVIPHLVAPRLAAELAECRAGRPPAGRRTTSGTTVLYYGRWAPIKGLDVLAAAIRQLPDEDRKRLRLRLFGNGDADWLRRCFDGVELGGLEIEGWLDDAQKPRELAEADVVVLPSRAEGFGASLLEAMAAGVPLLVSDAGAIPEVVHDYPAAKVVPLGEPVELGEALRAVLARSWPDADAAASASLPARYSAATVVGQLAEIYLGLAADSAGDHVRRRLRELDDWGEQQAWTGSDPYDGGNAGRLVSPFLGSARGRQAVTQVVKRSAIDLRPLLRIPPGLSAVTLANVARAHAIGGFRAAAEHRSRLIAALESLQQLRLDAFPEASWGYHWDTQTRVLYYPRTEPNCIATAFAALALLDGFTLTQDERWLNQATSAAEFFVNRVGQTVTPAGIYFGYLAGDDTPIHNSNLLACQVLARVGNLIGRQDLLDRAASGVRWTLAHQRSDGGWRYGETANTSWIDGFHTGYVLDSLRSCDRDGVDAPIRPALDAGLEFYWTRLFESDGMPRYYENRVYPIDSQSVAQGIQTFALAAEDDPAHLARAGLVVGYAESRLRKGELYRFQRRRLWSNDVPHMRWTISPMLLALTHYLAALDAGR